VSGANHTLYNKIERDFTDEGVDVAADQPRNTSPSREIKHKRSRSGTESGHRRARSGTQSHRSRSRRPSIRNVVDEGQAAEENARPRSAPHGDGEKFEPVGRTRSFSVPGIGVTGVEEGSGKEKQKDEEIETVIPPSQSGTTRPTHDGIAYPFKLKVPESEGRERNPSIMTLRSEDDAEGLQDEIPTIVPPSQSGTTRPTHDGIAYPFKLKVPESEGRERNPSIMTLHSESDAEAGPGMDDGLPNEEVLDKSVTGALERPPIERFFTAQEAL
jgi:hypothetical protein